MMLQLNCARISRSTPSFLTRRAGQLRQSSRVAQEHDVLLLRQSQPRSLAKFQLSPSLRPDTVVKLSHGATLRGSDIIGRPIPSVVTDSKGHVVRLSEVTLSQYLTNQPRVATPIYPQDATTIVSILDINVPVPGEDPEADAGPVLEIFEAGTGMGSLTLHIARSLHGANPPVPHKLRQAMLAAPYKAGLLLRNTATDESPINGAMPHAQELESPELEAQLQSYRASRRAILHSLDINPSTSRKAHGVVQGFCRGRYLLNVDFHLRTIKSFVESRFAENGRQPFLSHAVLDLPGSADHADLVIQAIRPLGKLVVFFPSVTQVLEFITWATETKQKIHLEKTVELMSSSWAPGFTDAVGGREWDVRIVTPRKVQREAMAAAQAASDGNETVSDTVVAEPKTVHVCRPKVGHLVGGGGFLAVFSKRMTRSQSDQDGQDLTERSAESTSFLDG
ncbi:adenine-N(1)--methyltransferase [Plectosphaerella plurivora]|uniref:tRNA (adenine(58)-N(1))-methyltransferase catalytic subunit TRM61 n=1 Tax=Plectosphaerella plurivora TaxID=936078 RepID=A0A9P9A4D6_9PEZI|nr:adenine-N(1)--methyltransferase [Plectosphaerella plurivora]